MKKNLMIDDVEVIEEEVALYKKAGGGTLVDCTNHGIKLDQSPLVKLSQSTGVHIVCGTGFYVDAFIDDEIKVRIKCVWDSWLVDCLVG